MSENPKQENRIMAEYSIAKSFKGILRIGHILELVKNEEDRLFNSTYYGIPKALMNISGGTYSSDEIGYNTPIDGMNGSINRYNSSNPNIGDDKLKLNRVPMTDSMGNYLNWNIGLDGVTIGSNEDINGTEIDLAHFTQTDYISIFNNKNNNLIWQEKYFPVVESGKIVIGLNNKDYSSNKYKINSNSSLVIESKNNFGKLIVDNFYDKSNPRIEVYSSENNEVTKTFITYDKDSSDNLYRTIYTDDKSKVEEYDVFMYRQDNYDTHNYNYGLDTDIISNDDLYIRGNDEVLENYTNSNLITAKPIRKTVDANVGIVNLKEYVMDVIGKYMKSSIVEVPTGAIINQFCSLEKWYGYPDEGGDGQSKDANGQFTSDGYPGHRPAMMAKRNASLMSDDTNESTDNNAFIQTSIMGACRKVNKLINTNYNFKDKENQDENLAYSPEGFYNEIIPLYKRDYVLCDGSMYAIYLYPKNFKTESYPNRRDSVDRFLPLFYTIGYQYTESNDYVASRFRYTWDETDAAYKVVNKNLDIIDSSNCLKLKNDNSENSAGWADWGYKAEMEKDRHSIFVEDLLTILAFEKIYEKFSQATDVGFEWNYKNVCNWLANEKIPDEYAIQSFLGISKDQVKTFIDRRIPVLNKETNTYDELEEVEVMELPYYNFYDETVQYFEKHKIQNEDVIEKLPVIRLGREVRTFKDLINFYDQNENNYAIIEAYKLPQIQYLITIMTSNPTVDAIATIMLSYFGYNFQVPNLTNSVPSFIGSSGIEWCDKKYNKLRKVNTWSSNYTQDNYMHRHFLFVEPGLVNPANAYQKLNPSKRTTPPTEYALSGTLEDNSKTQHVASAACRGGVAGKSKTCKYGKDDNPNYIWNELGAGSEKQNNLTISNSYIVHSNGMIYPLLQAKTDRSDYIAWNTGNNRVDTEVNGYDFNQRERYHFDIDKTEKIYDKSVEDLRRDETLREAKALYYNANPYGWEHYDDPRFSTSEPNRGRTSNPINHQYIESLSKLRYEMNGVNFEFHTTSNYKNAEWFSPENIKMLPLIKL